MATEQPKRRICRTPEEAYQAGRELVRTRGDRLTEKQIIRFAAKIRPYLDRFNAA